MTTILQRFNRIYNTPEDGGGGGGAPAPAATPPATPAPAADPAAGTPAPAKLETALSDPANQGEPKKPEFVSAFGEKWREELAGEDADMLKRLQRFKSPQGLWQKVVNQDKLISSGAYKRTLGENPTPEELAEYRKLNDVPESADKYDVKLDNGIVFSDEDKPYIDNFMKAAHALNVPQKVAKGLLAAYAENVESAQAATTAADLEYKRENEDKLRLEWGPDFRANMNAISNHLGTLPKELSEALINGRGSDGRPLMSNIHVLNYLADQAIAANPMATLMPGRGQDAVTGLETEVESIQKQIGDYNSAYWTGPKGSDGMTALQRRYLQIQEAKAKMA